MDKGWVVQKNCRPFKIYETPNNPSHYLADKPGMMIHDGDTNGVASGSSLALLVDGVPHFAGIHTSTFPGGDANHFGKFDINRRYNFAIDGQTIYDHFLEFRRRFGRN